MSFIELTDIGKRYGKNENIVHALSEVTLSFDRGDYVALRGKSGCGKSTLLGVLGGIIQPTEGEYLFGKKEISEHKINELSNFRNSQVAMVVQHYALIHTLSVFDNIALPLYYRKISKKEIRKKVYSMMEMLGISDKKDCYPYEISGGQSQRVAIARAVVSNPKLMLADEPTGALDEKTGNDIMEIFQRLNEEGMTIVVATHDKDLASLCNREIVLADGKVIDIRG